MRVQTFLDGGRPKVAPRLLEETIKRAGLEIGTEDPDFGVVVGGDGRFSRYGRTEEIPLLFVGVRSHSATGSKAYLAATTFDKLPSALKMMTRGEYTVAKHRRLGVFLNGAGLGEVFTDVYLERGSESTCIRYNVKVDGPSLRFEEAAIGDGVVISTSAGATGYYSYPDRLKGDWMDPHAFGKIRRDQIGVCHIAPTYTERAGTGKHPLRYTLPFGGRVELSLFRDADARLYGTTNSRSGIKVSVGDRIDVVPGKRFTNVIRLRTSAGTAG